MHAQAAIAPAALRYASAASTAMKVVTVAVGRQAGRCGRWWVGGGVGPPTMVQTSGMRPVARQASGPGEYHAGNVTQRRN